MAESLRITPGRLQLFGADGVAVEDTNLPSVVTAPEAALTVTVDAVFPNFKFASTEYLYGRGGTNGGAPYKEACITLKRIAAQEWGSEPGDDHNLPDIVLGAVPAGADYLDIVLTGCVRTKDPDAVIGDDPLPLQPETGLIPLGDNALKLETHGVWRRHVTFHLLEGQVIMKRRQSVGSTMRVKLLDYKYDDSVSFTPADPPFPPQPHWALFEGSAGGCSKSGTIDLAATYRLDLLITPASHKQGV